MRGSTIARNYAETLLELARRDGGSLERYGTLIRETASAMGKDVTLRRFLESPRVTAEHKNALFVRAFENRAPRNFIRFLAALVNHGRQMLLPEVAHEYQALVDEAEGRVHAQVTVARQTSDGERDAIARELSRAMGKNVVPHLEVDPSILGGVVVKVGDTVMDGSVRRRLSVLRARLTSVR